LSKTDEITHAPYLCGRISCRDLHHSRFSRTDSPRSHHWRTCRATPLHWKYGANSQCITCSFWRDALLRAASRRAAICKMDGPSQCACHRCDLGFQAALSVPTLQNLGHFGKREPRYHFGEVRGEGFGRSSCVVFVLNRLTNMLDGVTTTRYAYTAVSQLLSEDGPWSDDTVTDDLQQTRSSRREEGLTAGAEMLEPPHVGCYHWVGFRRRLCSWIARAASERRAAGVQCDKNCEPRSALWRHSGIPKPAAWWIGWKTQPALGLM
jgi:hypothetical protein